MQVLPHLSAALIFSPAGGGTVLRVCPLAVGAGVLDSPKPPLCKGRWHPACYARWMTEGLLPRLRCRGRAELGTSQQSLERRSRAWNVAAELGTSRVSRASGCFSRVEMPSAARKAFPAHGEGGAKRRMRSLQRARYPHPVSRMPCALTVVRCAAGYINGKDRRIRKCCEFADPFFLFIPYTVGTSGRPSPTWETPPHPSFGGL